MRAVQVRTANFDDVSRHFARFAQPDAVGHGRALIEAVSEGVIFTTLEYSVGEADSVAVLRPRLTDDQRREVIARAFSHAAATSGGMRARAVGGAARKAPARRGGDLMSQIKGPRRPLSRIFGAAALPEVAGHEKVVRQRWLYAGPCRVDRHQELS